MEYQRAYLDEKRIIGFTARSSNASPDMQQTIFGLWQRLFAENAAKDRQTARETIGLYSDYSQAQDASELEYDVTVGFEETDKAVPEGMTEKRIPAGEYAVFTSDGGAEAVGELWREIWNIPLDRRYSGDFELYADGGRTVKIFIALN